jgi:hypothetical protein
MWSPNVIPSLKEGKESNDHLVVIPFKKKCNLRKNTMWLPNVIPS